MSPEKLKELRVSLQLTQSELARLLDVKENTVYRWETGRLPISRMVELALMQISATHTAGGDIRTQDNC